MGKYMLPTFSIGVSAIIFTENTQNCAHSG